MRVKFRYRRTRLRSFTQRSALIAIALFTALTCSITHSIVESAQSATRPVASINRSNEYTDSLSKAFSAKNCRRDFPDSNFFEALDQTFTSCQTQQLQTTLQTLKEKLAQEKDLATRLDLELLIQSADQALRGEALEQKYRIPYLDLSQGLVRHFRSLLSGSSANPKQALAQLKQFAGTDVKSQPLSAIAKQRIQAHLAQSELYLPETIKSDITPQQTQANLQRIKQLFDQTKVSGYADAFVQLESQLTEYTRFVRQDVLPKARIGFQLPSDLYAFELEEQGVDVPIDTLIQQARAAFQDVQGQMQAIAAQIAQQKGWQQTDYRAVVRSLKQEQLSGAAILKLYQQRQKEIESIIRREKLVSLPDRRLTIRLSTAEENTSFPVPRYYSRKNEGVFLIPVLSDRKDYDDFTYPAVTWTLTAHEGRPGHDLQFATIQAQQIAKARSFTFNAASHEGWALYAESITKPYMPLEGQLISLQFQLLRSARAFLEPELQLGRITIAEAMRVLTQDAGYSRFFADQEIQRYTTRMPGQAPAYFYGYQCLVQLRQEAEAILGDQFNPQQFHDLVLSQGFLPPKLLRVAVLQHKAA